MSKPIIIHEERKFDWKTDELDLIQLLFLSGKKPTEIAKETKNEVEDITLALMHLYFKGEIELGVSN
ncbi:hypothetical protein [Vagococcus carniphilus]|uniref:hypothetical protein n=1 Tax=Vagococcus carniphilus TaxID=218144 RepID=UPI0028918731|nr:hypothetical protein [Vagococcus carniphilus]MDT2864665.1 hypothetical protein [Vagococcus carniphilus]